MIKGKKIYLVPFNDDHLHSPDYLSWLRDYEVIKYIGREEYLEPVSFEEVKQYVEDVWKNEFCSFYAMCAIDTGDFIGTIKINYLNAAGRKSGIADIGIMIGNRKFWGKGMATDALTATCAYAFSELKARKLTAGALAPNQAVIRAFQKIGFVVEGRLRGKVYVDGDYVDHVLLGCFSNEFLSHE